MKFNNKFIGKEVNFRNKYSLLISSVLCYFYPIIKVRSYKRQLINSLALKIVSLISCIQNSLKASMQNFGSSNCSERQNFAINNKAGIASSSCAKAAATSYESLSL